MRSELSERCFQRGKRVTIFPCLPSAVFSHELPAGVHNCPKEKVQTLTKAQVFELKISIVFRVTLHSDYVVFSKYKSGWFSG